VGERRLQALHHRVGQVEGVERPAEKPLDVRLGRLVRIVAIPRIVQEGLQAVAACHLVLA